MDQRQAYEVPGRQLGWRVSQLQAQGHPYQVVQQPGGVYVVIVQQPQGATPFAYQLPRRTMSADALRWAIAIAVIVAVVAAAAFVFLRADVAPVASQPAQPAGLLDGLRLPWDNQPNGEPVVEHVASRWRWPWEAAGDALADAMATVQNTVNIVAGTLLFVLVMLIVLSVMRKVRR